ncbi:tRNA pseudouridine(38-40) synthase TruA [Agromyces atrinae]|uniref:tRNA pseudouridine synthase A n=1 Tax=Agromyces atrinae TaxID=592376 RepID=A0A4Q2M6E7_9MICO|nr:tRNA pseudouridine(38-40) synthase TruA [Agromyces atrinae]MCI2957845.1 tRNA pseudouridine(38-40) synthase TruA [Agromyces atrinae]NYD66849.1 tRNA pseudouridine38-40 synthase [Agromyces atrinae]RXZ87498.1 tRNA pseudouridine(38-40) synthase TruA [Agromyces atrinae]
MNAPADPSTHTRIRLDVAYDGTDFNGWSTQPGLRTVQGVLEEALRVLFTRHAPPPRLSVAGRTDAGVHALGQVAHVDLTRRQIDTLINPRRPRNVGDDADAGVALARRLNGILGPATDVVISGASVAPPGFDARFSALWRRYEYRLAPGGAVRDPIQRRRTTWHSAPLDVEAMDAAAAGLVGLHDFAAYCKPREGATTIRTLQVFRWSKDDDGVLTADLRADAFCHSMVRALVGACVAVGDGRLAVDDVVALRNDAVRSNAFNVMAARGLTLMEVGYPDDAELAVRAELTRQRRVLSVVVPD